VLLIDLCEGCGMCCNGTLFNYVTLVPDDLPKLAKYPQLKLIVRNEQETFDEGCVLHTGTGCGAYEDRPDTCKRYVCNVLRGVQREELTEEEAVLIIKEGKALVEIVKEYVAFEPGRPMAVSSWDAPPEGIAEDARLAWDRTAWHLGKHFLGTVVDEVDPSTLPTATGLGSPAFSETERQNAKREALFVRP
jgi:Fe-S-cluster containining protein